MDGGDQESRFHTRMATHDDVQAIAMIGAAMQRYVKPPFDAPINWKKAIDLICDVIEKWIAIVLEENGKVIGTCGLRIVEDEWRDMRYIDNVWLTVHPDHRSLAAFGALMRAAALAAEPFGLPVIIGHLELDGLERKELLFRRYMQPLGHFYLLGALRHE